MKKLLIFAIVVLFGCSEEHEITKKICSPFRMTISDAIPIQFWINGVETFNQKEVCGINSVCFCQPFNCDDEVRIQFRDVTGGLYLLSILDDLDQEITTLQFYEVSEGVYQLVFTPNLLDEPVCNEKVRFQITSTMVDASFATDLDGWTNTGGTEEFLNGAITGNIDNWTDEGGGVWTDIPWAYSGGLSAAYIQLATPGPQSAGNFETDELAHVYIKSNLQTRLFNFSVRWDDNISAGSLSALHLYCRYYKAGIQVGVDDQIKSILVPSGATITDSFTTVESDFDEIRFYFRGTNSAAFEAQMGFSIISMVPTLVALNDWVYDGGQSAATANAPFIWDSKYLTKIVSPINEQFTITINYLRDTGDANATLILYLSDGSSRQAITVSPAGEGTGAYTKDITVTPSITYDRLEFKAFMTEEFFSVYSLSTEGDIMAYSDCVDIKDSHECTTLIRYDNAKDFADIEYSTLSPAAEFYIRVPAVFFHERNTEEQERFETSGQTIVRLRDEIKVKRLLEVGFLPDYMHRKLLLILAHDTIEIDGEEWVRNDPYEKVEGNRRYPLKKANVLLTQQGYIKRNIL